MVFLSRGRTENGYEKGCTRGVKTNQGLKEKNFLSHFFDTSQAFCTHGILPDSFFPQAMALAKKKGMTLIGINDWYGSVFRPTLPKPYFTDGHPDEIDLEEAEAFGREMVALSRRIYAGETDLIPKFPDIPKAGGYHSKGCFPKRRIDQEAVYA